MFYQDLPPPEEVCEREKLIRVLKENLRTEEMTLVLLKKLQQSQQINQIPQSVPLTPQAAHTKDHSNMLSQLPTGKSAQPPMPHVPHHAKPPPPPLNRLVKIINKYICLLKLFILTTIFLTINLIFFFLAFVVKVERSSISSVSYVFESFNGFE